LSFLNHFKYRRCSKSLSPSDSGLKKDPRSPERPHIESLFQAGISLERILTQNIIPFWYPDVIDKQDGGYRLNHGLDGKWRGPANKSLVAQARTMWFFAHLVNSRFGTRDFLEAASHGYDFLRERMWDKEFGGFYWEVDSSGQIATVSDKRSYGQAFGLYALTEYAVASGDLAAKATAKHLVDLMEMHAHDSVYGGYPEILRRDWSPAPRTAVRNDITPLKRMNTHIHLMEAVTTFHDLTREPIARERLIELILINSNSVVRKNVGACTDGYQDSWEPLRSAPSDRVSYGHDVENIWLLVEACKSAGIYGSLFLDLYRTLFRYALDHGFDWRNGGFYESGPLHGPADRREKVWWVQAEGLVAALQMHRLTGEEIFWDCFLRTLDWIVHHQTDWTHGDWYETIGKDGRPSGVKAGPWKCPYHNGRAMLQCLNLLAEAPGEPSEAV
jgi:mannose/cellobiose epimerase-like protein (N-acyl-D-glucosamine 2-epimerase family)